MSILTGSKLDWEFYKAEIERIYVTENKTLREVREIMESTRNFRATKAQYERKFKQWKFRKYPMKPDVWRFVNQQIAKRKREKGKDSEVYLYGVLCPPSKVRKETARHGFVSTIDMFRPDISPKTPEGVVVCSPGPATVQLEWNQALPWFQFLDSMRSPKNQGNTSIWQSTDASKHRSSSVSITNICGTSILTHPITSKDILRSLGSILEWDSSHSLKNIQSISWTAAVLSIIMPEEYQGQHRIISEKFCDVMNPVDLDDMLNLQLFLISNNFTFHKSWNTYENCERARMHDERIMEIFHQTGWNSSAHIKFLLSMKEPTAEAIAAKLFASALRTNDLKTVLVMLRAGMSPDILIDSPKHRYPLTPLEFAASEAEDERSVEMSRLLLSYGARVNREGREDSALCHAITRRHRRLMEILIANGACVLPKTLNLAIRTGDFSLVLILLAAGADVNAALPVCEAYDRFWKTTPLGIAAQLGNVTMARLLLMANAKVNLKGSSYLSPLILAVQSESIDIVELLIDAGVDLESKDEIGRTAIELAARNGNAELCRLLLENGAKIIKSLNKPALFHAVGQNKVELVSVLLYYGARVDDIYCGRTILGTAIELGNCAMIQMLRQAGATITPKERLCKIGNMETANYLENTGLLSEIMQTSGSDILIFAIREDMDDLIQRLLGYSLDFNARLGRCFTVLDGLKPWTALDAAISKGNIRLIKILIDRGARATMHTLTAAVWEALATGNLDIIRLLLSSLKNLRRCHCAATSFNIAVEQQNYKLIRFLLQDGIDPRGKPIPCPAYVRLMDIKNYDHQKYAGWWYDDIGGNIPMSVLETAAQRGDRSMLQMLLKVVKWKPKHTGSALAVAIKYKKTHLVPDLVDAGADLNQELPPPWDTLNPLLLAIECQQISLVLTLLQAGADVNHTGHLRRTALQKAVEIGNIELVDILLDEGADVNCPAAHSGGATALQLAAIQGYLGIAQKLIQVGADINADKARINGRTALEGAAEHGRIDMLYLLLREGALIEGYGRQQYVRAVKLAETYGHHAAANLLKSYGGWSESDILKYDLEYVGMESEHKEYYHVMDSDEVQELNENE